MLPFYNNILVTTDFTPNSENAFRHAVMLARLNNAKIHLLHVIQQVDPAMHNFVSTVIGEDLLAEYEKNNMEKARSELKKRLDHFIDIELANFPNDRKHIADTVVTIGHPVVKILEEAKRLDADVIVMGTHSKGALEQAFLGSVTEKVLRKANRPVFAIPLPA